jgi:hypothetical protein
MTFAVVLYRMFTPFLRGCCHSLMVEKDYHSTPYFEHNIIFVQILVQVFIPVGSSSWLYARKTSFLHMNLNVFNFPN